MTRWTNRTTRIAAAAAVATVSIGWSESQADTSASVETDSAVALARVCWHEADGNRDDCLAIAEVLRRVGRGDLARGAIRYSSRVFDRTRTDSRGHVAHLDRSHAETGAAPPPAWPHEARLWWPRARQRWAATLALADDIVAGRARAPDGCRPHHWGCPDCGDREIAIRRGWLLVVSCGQTRNDFWLVPRRR